MCNSHQILKLLVKHMQVAIAEFFTEFQTSKVIFCYIFEISNYLNRIKTGIISISLKMGYCYVSLCVSLTVTEIAITEHGGGLTFQRL